MLYFCAVLNIAKPIVFAILLFSFIPEQQEKIKVVSFDQLEKTIKRSNDTLYVVNYWATWCRPCVQELPFFIEAGKKFSAEKVRVIFVSLNSVKELPKVQQFAYTKNIQEKVILLDAGNPNVWIDKVDSSWGGSIPATVMYKKGKKVFFKEGEFTQTQIDSIIILKNKTP